MKRRVTDGSEGPKIPKKRPITPGPAVRLPIDLKSRLEEVADRTGTSLNALCVSFLEWALETYLKKTQPK